MNLRVFGWLSAGIAAAVIVACKDDPTASLRTGLSRVELEFDYREVIIADSVRVVGVERDAQGTPLTPTMTILSRNPAIAAVSPSSDAPLPQTAFYVKGVTFGTTWVVAQAGGIFDSMQVATFPATIAITGSDTVTSGIPSSPYAHTYFDKVGQVVTGVPDPVWSVSDTNRAVIDAGARVIQGRDPPFVTVQVRGTGSPAGGITGDKQVTVVPDTFRGTIEPAPAEPGQVVKISRAATEPIYDSDTRVFFGGVQQTIVSGSRTDDSVKVAFPDLAAAGDLAVLVTRTGTAQVAFGHATLTVAVPAFAGTVSPSTANPAESMTLTRTSGPAFDADTRAYVKGTRTFTELVSADELNVIMPGVDTAGAVTLRLTRMDAGDFAREVSVTSATASFDDPFDDVNDNPATAPAITADGDYFVVLHGSCSNGVGSGDCDDFFRITNSSGTNTLVTVNIAWFGGADIDGYGLDPTFDFCTFDGGCPAATGANPEQFSMTIPAGETWFIYLNLWDPHGVPATLTRVRVSGLP